MHIILTSLATISGLSIGLLIYALVGSEIGANIGVLAGIVIITLSVYLIETSYK